MKKVFPYTKIILGGLLLFSLVIGFFCFSSFDVVFEDSERMQYENMVHSSSAVPSTHACCVSELINHLELWGNLSSSVLSNFDMVFGLLVVAFVATSFPSFFNHPVLRIDIVAIRYKQWKRTYPNRRLFDPQLIALSRGILHSKAF